MRLTSGVPYKISRDRRIIVIRVRAIVINRVFANEYYEWAVKDEQKEKNRPGEASGDGGATWGKNLFIYNCLDYFLKLLDFYSLYLIKIYV